MDKDSETILVTETGLGRYQVEAHVGANTLLLDEPISAGGLGPAPIPTGFSVPPWAPAPP